MIAAIAIRIDVLYWKCVCASKRFRKPVEPPQLHFLFTTSRPASVTVITYVTANVSVGTRWSAEEQTGLLQHRPNVPRPAFRLLIFPKRQRSRRHLATCHVPAICDVGDVENSRCLSFQPPHLHMKCRLHNKVTTATERTP